MSEAIPAATLILLRDRRDGVEVLMVERAATMAFAAGAMVFPGGRIDPGDRALALAMGDEALAPRLAAIRETIEEAGIAACASDDAATLRTSLVEYARWRPDREVSRVFDTHFYVARCPDDASEPVVDGTENRVALWVRPDAVLTAAGRGEASLLFPTRRVLERLVAQRDVAGVLADAARWPVRTITPCVERRGDGDWLTIPDDLGYPVTAERLDRVVRQ